jgi:copper chaperone
MKTRIAAEIAAALVALALPAVPLASEEHGKEGDHACEHPRTGTVTAGDSSAKGTRVVIPVAGMHCSMCAQRVTTALADVDGVKWVETSVDAKQAVVVYDGAKAKPEALAAAVKGVGYEPGKPKAN